MDKGKIDAILCHRQDATATFVSAWRIVLTRGTVSARDVLALASTCRRARALAADDRVWSVLFARHFGTPYESGTPALVWPGSAHRPDDPWPAVAVREMATFMGVRPDALGVLAPPAKGVPVPAEGVPPPPRPFAHAAHVGKGWAWLFRAHGTAVTPTAAHGAASYVGDVDRRGRRDGYGVSVHRGDHGEIVGWREGLWRAGCAVGWGVIADPDSVWHMWSPPDEADDGERGLARANKSRDGACADCGTTKSLAPVHGVVFQATRHSGACLWGTTLGGRFAGRYVRMERDRAYTAGSFAADGTLGPADPPHRTGDEDTDRPVSAGSVVTETIYPNGDRVKWKCQRAGGPPVDIIEFCISPRAPAPFTGRKIAGRRWKRAGDDAPSADADAAFWPVGSSRLDRLFRRYARERRVGWSETAQRRFDEANTPT
jgi:hypothetical protein